AGSGLRLLGRFRRHRAAQSPRPRPHRDRLEGRGRPASGPGRLAVTDRSARCGRALRNGCRRAPYRTRKTLPSGWWRAANALYCAVNRRHAAPHPRPERNPVAPTRRSPLPIPDVTVDDAFWAPRREIARTKTIPHQEHQLRTGGQFKALELAWKPGDEGEPHIFWESDVAKWIEAASYALAREHDADLDAAVDEAIALLSGAQQD